MKNHIALETKASGPRYFHSLPELNSASPRRDYLERSFLLFDRLIENERNYSADLNSLLIETENLTVNWLTEGLPDAIWQNLPVPSHRFVNFSNERELYLKRALQRIERHGEASQAIFKNFVANIAWLEIRDNFSGQDTQITSSSFPILPYTIFFSDKALYHIPPNSVSQKPSEKFLAENLFHEAVHQQVNVTLLEKEIFIDHFDSKTSPKIKIAWRAASSLRNQNWELDRVLHAICVYIELMGFRRIELQSSDLTPEERYSFTSAARSGIDSLLYLVEQLNSHKPWFTPYGCELLVNLTARAVSETSKTKSLLELFNEK